LVEFSFINQKLINFNAKQNPLDEYLILMSSNIDI